MSVDNLPPFYIPDLDGTDLRPDPDAIQTVADLIEAMRDYRRWAGNPSFRDLAKRCHYRFAASTFCKVLKGSALSRPDVAHDFIGACGATAEYQERFDNAWRRVAASEDREL
jgi:hypothetical protein